MFDIINSFRKVYKNGSATVHHDGTGGSSSSGLRSCCCRFLLHSYSSSVVPHISCCRWGCCCCCFFLGRICVHSYISARSHSLAVVVVWLESLTISDIMLCSMFYHTIYFDRGSFYCIIHILFYPLALLGLSCLLVLSPLPPRPHILLCARALGQAGWLAHFGSDLI